MLELFLLHELPRILWDFKTSVSTNADSTVEAGINSDALVTVCVTRHR